jgi:hypothetical protein
VSIAPFKSAGPHGITPSHLGHRTEHLISPLCCIFRAFLANGYIPFAENGLK